jgi:hypothetical protein
LHNGMVWARQASRLSSFIDRWGLRSEGSWRVTGIKWRANISINTGMMRVSTVYKLVKGVIADIDGSASFLSKSKNIWCEHTDIPDRVIAHCLSGGWEISGWHGRLPR